MTLDSNHGNLMKTSESEEIFLEENSKPPLHSVKGNMQPPSYQQVYRQDQQNNFYQQQPNQNYQHYNPNQQYPQTQQPNVVYQPQPQPHSRSQQSGCQSCIQCLCCCTLCAACFVEWCRCCEIILGCCEAFN